MLSDVFKEMYPCEYYGYEDFVDKHALHIDDPFAMVVYLMYSMYKGGLADAE